MNNKAELKKEIEKLRDKLNQASQNNEALSKEEMIKISRKLDELINKFYD
ncbi:aspartyl-phosphate phosphatase Spo0E family protein [Halanaerobacter jeridensis]|uniref:Ribosomal protein S2 n=1 Tax=Halanaerobacter jeridensis TaxID=706427 RepID=A0A938XQD2_9FIRM|nr:aspartyl-phosphate phosphatase Spo0E family protein [Halanaerobacter jeridensis]MBM7557908.1 ribosomal protein S2 [Halanaerobacter jeridensis]